MEKTQVVKIVTNGQKTLFYGSDVFSSRERRGGLLALVWGSWSYQTDV
jgi:hypothetical protein